MKKQIAEELIRNARYRIRSDPKLKKHLKTLVILGVVGIIVSGTLVIWAGVSLIQYAGQQLQEPIRAMGIPTDIPGNIPEQLETLGSSLSKQVQSIPSINTPSCLTEAQKLFTAEPWVSKSMVQIWTDLKTSCWGAESAPMCDGVPCEKI